MSYQEFILYDKFETGHWWYRGRRKILDTFLQNIPHHEEKVVIEIGPGTGGNLLFLFNNFKKKIGVEFNQEALNFAISKLKNNATLIKGDANQLKTIDKKADLVAFLDILYHKNIIDPQRVIDDACSLLTPEGYLLFTDGAFNFLAGEHSKSVDSARRFTSAELTRLLQKKFEIIKISYWGISLFFLVFLKRAVIEKIFPHKKLGQDSKLQTDLFLMPFLDTILYLCLVLESKLLKYINFPFGASIAVIAKKRKATS